MKKQLLSLLVTENGFAVRFPQFSGTANGIPYISSISLSLYIIAGIGSPSSSVTEIKGNLSVR